MESQAVFAALRDALATLYLEEQEARVVVTDAGLDLTRIPFHARAQTNWHYILIAAIDQARLEALLDLARNDYLDNEALHVAYTHYRHQLQQPRHAALDNG